MSLYEVWNQSRYVGRSPLHDVLDELAQAKFVNDVDLFREHGRRAFNQRLAFTLGYGHLLTCQTRWAWRCLWRNYFERATQIGRQLTHQEIWL